MFKISRNGQTLYPSITAYWLTELHSVTPCAVCGTAASMLLLDMFLR